MLNQQVLEGNWNQLKGKVREKWGQITDSDLEALRGKGDQLVGAIQKKTGEARDQIEKFLNSTIEGGAGMASRAMESGRQYAQDAAESFSDVNEQVSDSLRRGYHQAEELVHQRPAESLAVAFGIGLVAGTVLGLVLRKS